MATAKQLPSGNWRVQASITIDGKIIKKSFTESSPDKAKLSALTWKNQKKLIRSDPTNKTLSEAIDDYINLHSNIFAASTATGYRKIKRNYFSELMPIKINKITDKMFQNEINKMASRLSPKTISNAFGLIAPVLSECGIEKPKVKLPKKKKLIYKTPNVDNINKILKCTQGTVIELPILLAVLLGLRMSEIRGLKWDCVQDDYITIKNAIVDTDNGAVEEDNTKTYDGTRQIILPTKIKQLLDNIKRDGDYVVPLSANAITKRFSRLLQKHDIPHCRFHDLRHANASIMLMLKVPDKYAMERGGWSTTDTLKRIYQQTFSEEQKNISEMLDNYFDENFFS